MTNNNYFNCTHCGQSRGSMLKQIIDFVKNTITLRYKCIKCKKITNLTVKHR